MIVPVKQSINKHYDRLRAAKTLAENSNDKLQVILGPDRESESGSKEPLFWASRARKRSVSTVSTLTMTPNGSNPHFMAPTRRVRARSFSARPSRSASKKKRTVKMKRIQSLKELGTIKPLKELRTNKPMESARKSKVQKQPENRLRRCKSASGKRTSPLSGPFGAPEANAMRYERPQSAGIRMSIAQKKKLKGLSTAERTALQDMKDKLRSGTQLKPRKSAIRSRYAYQMKKGEPKRKRNGKNGKKSKGKRPTVSISVHIPQTKTEIATKVSKPRDDIHDTPERMRMMERELNQRLLLTPIAERDIDDVAIEQILMEDVTSLSDHGASASRGMNEEEKEEIEEEQKERSDDMKISEEFQRLSTLQGMQSSTLEHMHPMQRGGLMDVERGEFRFSPLKARSTEFENIVESPVYEDVSRSEEMAAEKKQTFCGESTRGSQGRQRSDVFGGQMVQGLQRKFEKLDSLFIEIAERIDAFDDCSSSFDFNTKLTVDV